MSISVRTDAKFCRQLLDSQEEVCAAYRTKGVGDATTLLPSSRMQRLFSSFPKGRPGIALLLLRIALSVIVFESLSWCTVCLHSPWALTALLATTVLLWLGLFSPAVSAVCLSLEVARLGWAAGGVDPVHACLLLHAVSLALLGPGGYSLDAVLYGRRLIVFPPDLPG